MTLLTYAWLALLISGGVLAGSVIVGVATRNRISWFVARIAGGSLLVLILLVTVLDIFGLH